MSDEPTRPWWRMKRWWAAAALLAVAGYLASLGPLAYCEARGWLGPTAAARLRTPAELHTRYVHWWQWRGWTHAGAIAEPQPPTLPDPSAPAEDPFAEPPSPASDGSGNPAEKGSDRS